MLVAVLGGLSLFVGHVSVAAAAGPARVTVVAVRASSRAGVPLPARGAPVVVSVRVRNATRCVFFAQRAPFSALYRVKTVSCRSGHASATLPAIANIHTRAVRLIYAVHAIAKSGAQADRRVKVLERGAAKASPAPATPAPAPVPVPNPSPTASLALSTTTIPPAGGTVTLTYASSQASSCTLASTPALWTGANPIAVDCNGSYQATVPAASGQQAWTITFTATSNDGQSAAAEQTLTEQAPEFTQSTNWSGYVVPSDSALITAASGRWTVPTLNCSATPNGGASTWVGIGGYEWPSGGDSGALLQTGVRTDCVNGVQQDTAWWELVPSNPDNELDFLGFYVSPGDSMEASVYQASDGTWATRVDDLTTGLSGVMVTGEGWEVLVDAGGGTFAVQGSTASLSYQGGYTAEWIVEDYGEGPDQAPAPFADYTTVTFTDLTTSLPSWSLTPNDGIEIAQNGNVLSVPSPPGSDGFSVSYTG